MEKCKKCQEICSYTICCERQEGHEGPHKYVMIDGENERMIITWGKDNRKPDVNNW